MKGHDLWIFLPTVSQPVRLSMSQRLTGQVANGDLARANFAGDYTAKLLRYRKDRQRIALRAGTDGDRPQRHLSSCDVLGPSVQLSGRSKPSSTPCLIAC